MIQDDIMKMTLILVNGVSREGQEEAVDNEIVMGIRSMNLQLEFGCKIWKVTFKTKLSLQSVQGTVKTYCGTIEELSFKVGIVKN